MPEFHQRSPTRRRLGRRQLLQLGGLAAVGIGLPELLKADASGAPNGDGKSRPKSCVFIYQYGGLSQLDSWDVKPAGPAEIRGPYQPIATAVPGYQVCELMPRLASLADKYAVIRSMSHAVPVHDVANRMLLAGQVQPALNAPSFGAIVTKLRPTEATMPAHVWLQKFGGGAAPPDATYLTGGHLGVAHSPLLLGAGHDDNPATPGFQMKVFETAADVPPARLLARRSLLDGIEGIEGTSLSKFQERAFELLTGSQARSAFDLEQEPAALRDKYGRNPLGQNLLLARRLIEAGTRMVNVVAWTGLKPGEKFMSVETWDMHGNAGVSIFEDGWNGLGFALPRCDAAVAALIEDLDQRGLLDTTLVVLVGEFGRTPRISRGAGAIGRDHWPNCYSAMLAGAGIQGGLVYGASDSQAAYVKDNPVSLENFTATLLHALGIVPETRISPDGFTTPASTGQPVLALHGV